VRRLGERELDLKLLPLDLLAAIVREARSPGGPSA
jgi:hypothetical protein